MGWPGWLGSVGLAVPSGGVVWVGSGKLYRPTRVYLERSIVPKPPPAAAVRVTFAENVSPQALSPSVAVTVTVTSPAAVQVSVVFWALAAPSVPPVVVQ